MATKVDIAGTNITASQMSEFFRVAGIWGSHINRDTLQAYIEGRNPFAFERNKYGHVIITFDGLDLTGAQEIVRLEEGGHSVGTYARECFRSTKSDSYDGNHRLMCAREYKVALMPTNDIMEDSIPTTENLRKRGMEYYHYGKPLAGLLPRIREKISDKQMGKMGVGYIAVLHDLIADSRGKPSVLYADCHVGGCRVDANWSKPDDSWNYNGCVAFPVE